MNNSPKAYFDFSRKERNGIIVLLVLIFVIAVILPKLWPLMAEEESVDFSAFELEVEQYHKEKFIPTKEISNADRPKEITEEKKPSLFPFDPNTATKEDFVKLGLSEKMANRILKFRGNKKPFKEKEDFKKIYGIENEFDRLAPFIKIESADKKKTKTKESEAKESLPKSEARIEPFPFDPNTASKSELEQLGFNPKAINNLLKYRKKGKIWSKKQLVNIFGFEETDYERLKNYIQFPEKYPKKAYPKKEEKKYTPKPKPVVYVDINTATAEEWQGLNGIGPSYSKRIVKYKNTLGGFHKVEQVAEVYKFPDSTYQKILPFLKNENISIKKININSASAEELKAHPYLRWKEANLIVKYRERHGPYANPKDIEKIKIITPELLGKITPYLSVE